MEIISYVISGQLQHRDSMGNGRIIKPGEFQYMSAGTGVRHSEFNPSKSDPVHFLQIWITPREKQTEPRYQELSINNQTEVETLTLVASPEGREGSIAIHQNVDLSFARLATRESVEAESSAPNHWIHVISGEIQVLDENLSPGDGAAVNDKTATAKVGEEKTALAGSGSKFTFAEESSVEFTGSKVTGSHDGGFKDITGHFTLDETGIAPTSGLITIQMKSVFTDDEKLTEHLKSADFFDVENFPTATFTMTDVKETGSMGYEVSGNFDLHGITKNITFPAVANRNGDTATVKAEFDINRKDFGIVYAGKADDLIRDEVVIRFNLEANSN
eukprot:g3926.t1